MKSQLKYILLFVLAIGFFESLQAGFSKKYNQNAYVEIMNLDKESCSCGSLYCSKPQSKTFNLLLVEDSSFLSTEGKK